MNALRGHMGSMEQVAFDVGIAVGLLLTCILIY